MLQMYIRFIQVFYYLSTILICINYTELECNEEFTDKQGGQNKCNRRNLFYLSCAYLNNRIRNQADSDSVTDSAGSHHKN